jgi:hypothetical protein
MPGSAENTVEFIGESIRRGTRPDRRHARTQAIPMACGLSGEPLLSRLPNRAVKVNTSLRFFAIFRISPFPFSLR